MLMGLLLAGCASIDKSPYPTTWPQPVRLDSGCRQINGIYRSGVAEQTYQHPHGDRLLALTLLPSEPSLKDAVSVALELGQDEKLEVSAYAKDGSLLARQDYRAEDEVYRCQDGLLLFEPAEKRGEKRAADNPLLGFAWGEVALQRTGDGSLLMRTTSGATGLAYLLIPVYAKSESWYLFKRFEAEPATPGK